MVWLLVILGVIAVLVMAVIVLYNNFVRLRNRVDNAWAQIEVQLKRRWDLIPNLVESVKGYAAHERGTFEAVTAGAGERAAGERPRSRPAAAEGLLSQALGRLFAVAEAYPELQADENFRQLQTELAETENRIAVSRQVYNDTVLTFNNAIQTFPGLLIAGVVRVHAARVLRDRGRRAAGGAARRLLPAAEPSAARAACRAERRASRRARSVLALAAVALLVSSPRSAARPGSLVHARRERRHGRRAPRTAASRSSSGSRSRSTGSYTFGFREVPLSLGRAHRRHLGLRERHAFRPGASDRARARRPGGHVRRARPRRPRPRRLALRVGGSGGTRTFTRPLPASAVSQSPTTTSWT